MNEGIRRYFAKIGSRGGQISRRRLSRAQAREMVAVRMARRAFEDYRTQCFWSFRHDLKITAENAAWVSEQLMRNGDREAWRVARRIQELLCR